MFGRTEGGVRSSLESTGSGRTGEKTVTAGTEDSGRILVSRARNNSTNWLLDGWNASEICKQYQHRIKAGDRLPYQASLLEVRILQPELSESPESSLEHSYLKSVSCYLKYQARVGLTEMSKNGESQAPIYHTLIVIIIAGVRGHRELDSLMVLCPNVLQVLRTWTLLICYQYFGSGVMMLAVRFEEVLKGLLVSVGHGDGCGCGSV